MGNVNLVKFPALVHLYYGGQTIFYVYLYHAKSDIYTLVVHGIGVNLIRKVISVCLWWTWRKTIREITSRIRMFLSIEYVAYNSHEVLKLVKKKNLALQNSIVAAFLFVEQ